MKRYLPVLPLFGMMGLIFFLSHQPGDQLNFDHFPMEDKVAHVGAYFLLGVSVILARPARERPVSPLRTALLTILFCLLFGVSDEFHQSFVPGRDVDAFDVLADTLGGGMAVLVWLLRRRFQASSPAAAGGLSTPT